MAHILNLENAYEVLESILDSEDMHICSEAGAAIEEAQVLIRRVSLDLQATPLDNQYIDFVSFSPRCINEELQAQYEADDEEDETLSSFASRVFPNLATLDDAGKLELLRHCLNRSYEIWREHGTLDIWELERCAACLYAE